MKLKITLLFTILTFCLQQTYAQCSGVDFEERNGIAILEMETKSPGSWANESASGASAGRTLAYRGSNSFSSPGNSTITYSVRISSPGTYRFIWRNRIGVVASSNATTEHNDSWLKINGSNFYGKRSDGHRVYPGGSGKSPVANGATSGGWFKIYTNTIDWSWGTWTSDRDRHAIYVDFNSAGNYTIQVSGRSNGHFVDRMVLYKEGSRSEASAQNLSLAQTNCSGGTPPPPPPPPPSNNQPPTVSITSPSNGQNFAVGSDVSIRVSANDPDGSVVKHQIYVDNILVDTDGSSYTPHIMRSVTAGSYVIRATVTDNSGATASTTVNITAGGNGTPPPPPPGDNAPPTVSITSPSNGQNFAVGSDVSIGLSANDPDGSIVKHQIYVDNILVDTDGSSFTPHIMRSITAGSYVIRATVTDNSGATASATVNITAGGSGTPPPPPPGNNVAPTVNITSPSNGQQVAVGSTVSVNVSANDTDGSVTKHQIWVDGVLVDTDGANFTPHPIQNISAGTHTIKVTVTDNDGATGSQSISISAGSGTPPPPPPSSGITFTLMNANTNQVKSTLSNGQNITSSQAQGINIRANTPSGTGSVRFALSGATSNSRVESVAPYALFGDSGGNYYPANLANGSYSLTATAYSGGSASGSIVATTTINFSVGSTSSKSALLFPNPVKVDGKVSLRLPEGSSGVYTYSVTNATGIQVDKGSFRTDPTQKQVDLQLSNVGRQVQGVYYLTLMSADSRQIIPVILEK